MTGPLGKPGLPPAVVRDHLGKLLAAVLEAVPEERRAAAADELAQALDKLAAKPAEAGETILFGEAAETKMSELVRDALEQARREARDDEAPTE